MAERAGLENRISRKRDGGSNPSLSENLARDPRGGQKAEKIVQLGVDTYMPLPVSSLTVEEDSTKKNGQTI